jgi:hypothetical protein
MEQFSYRLAVPHESAHRALRVVHRELPPLVASVTEWPRRSKRAAIAFQCDGLATTSSESRATNRR